MLEDHWYVACRSRKLRDKPLALTIFSHPLVLFRAKGGIPSVLEDRCPHRNMPLSAGKVTDGVLQCAYHGWCFRHDGSLANIPSLPDARQWPSRLAVKGFEAHEQDGYVWVRPGENRKNELPPRLPHIESAGWTSFRMETVFNAPVQDCLENFLDCPHAAFVHRRWFRSPSSRQVRAVVRYLDDGAEAEYFNEDREKSVVWKTLAPRKGGMRHIDRFIAPATSRVDYLFDDGRHYIITSHCTPVDDQTSRVFTTISFRFPRLGPVVRLFFQPLSEWIIRQDVEALNRQRQNVHRFGGERYVYARSDLLARPIADWRRALHEGGTPPGSGKEFHVDIAI